MTIIVDLTILQERCRKDPQSYVAEYNAQQSHYLALLASAALRPTDPSPRLPDVASFVASISPLYGSKAAAAIAEPTLKLLTDSAAELQPECRRALVRTLALLRAKGVADPKAVIPLFFRLLGCEDKQLRRMVHGHIIADVRRMQAAGDAGRRSLQAFLFGMVDEPNQVLVKRTLHVLADLFRKRIWNDSRTANVIASCVFHEAAPVALIAAKFLLDSESKSHDFDDGGSDMDDGRDCDDDDAENRMARSYVKHGRDGRKASDMWKAYGLMGKKSSKKKRAMERKIDRVTRLRKTTIADNSQNSSAPSFAAMMLLNDPQAFAERMYSDLQTRRRNEPYENRLVLINLLTRLVGTFKLIVLNLYPFLQRYLQPAQPEVTKVLAYLAQGCHELVPQDALHPVVRALADNFVSERCSAPSIAAGLNSVRAICARVPLAIFDDENEAKPENEQEAPLLEDLVEYRHYRDKGVVMAARSLIALYRDVNPRLLRKKDRGRAAAEAIQKNTVGPAPAYGRLNYATGVEGVELLESSSDAEDVPAGGDGYENLSEDELHPKNTFEASAQEGQSKSCEVEEENGITEDTAGLDEEGDPLVSGNDNNEEANASEHDDEKNLESENDNDDSVASQSNEDISDEDGDDNESAASEDSDDVSGGDGEFVDTDSEHRGERGVADGEGQMSSYPHPVEIPTGSNVLDVAGGDVRRTDQLRILTTEDFRRIRARSAARLVHGVASRAPKSGVISDTGKPVDPEDIQGVIKKERKTLEERMESVLAGREGRERYGSRRGSQKGGGSSNRAKLKTKSNSMVIHKQRRKNRMSRREKQQMKKKKRAYR